MNKICFVLDTHYPNYTSRLKTTSLKSFIDLELDVHGFGFLISTNRPEDFQSDKYTNRNIHVFDIDKLRENNKTSLQCELLPDDPVGLYPSKFPWNLERLILKKAGEMGYNIVINLDSDVVIDNRFDALYIKKYLNDIYEENTVMTNQAIFVYEEQSTREEFHLHEKYKQFFSLNHETSAYNSWDGPVIAYMGKTSKDIIKYADIWDMLTTFGYKKEHGYGYGNIVCGNMSLCIPMSDWKLKWKDLPFTPHHKYEDRPPQI